VLAAAMYPPPKSTPGMAYSHGYSGGSVGPGVGGEEKKMLELGNEEARVRWGRTFEHVQHTLCDHEAARYVYERQEHRQRSQHLGQSLGQIASAHDEETADADNA
jgi:hypothetical protein